MARSMISRSYKAGETDMIYAAITRLPSSLFYTVKIYRYTSHLNHQDAYFCEYLHGLDINGRRHTYSSILGKRECYIQGIEHYSDTCNPFAAPFDVHTQPCGAISACRLVDPNSRSVVINWDTNNAPTGPVYGLWKNEDCSGTSKFHISGETENCLQFPDDGSWYFQLGSLG